MNKIEKYISDAQARAARRKSPWNILLFMVGFICIGLIWFYLSKHIIYLFQSPTASFKDISDKNNVQMIFITIPLFFPSIAWGYLCANILMWLVPPARKRFNKEAKGHKKCSFKEATGGLFKAAVILSIICIPIAIFASSKIKI